MSTRVSSDVAQLFLLISCTPHTTLDLDNVPLFPKICNHSTIRDKQPQSSYSYQTEDTLGNQVEVYKENEIQFLNSIR